MTETPNPAPTGDPLVLGSVCLAALILPLSFSAGAVATPAIGRALGGSPEALTWITNGFMLTFGSLLMAAGTLADRYGRRLVFTLGVAIVTGFSLALGLASSVWLIDLLRAGQGVGAAAALAGGTAALAQDFEGHARTRAFSLLGTTFGVGLAFGPVITGFLIAGAGWRSIFLVGALVGAAALVLGPPRMRETRDPAARSLDWPGTVSFTAMLTALTVAVIEAPGLGWGSPVPCLLLAAATLLLMAFVAIESRAARPMLDLGLFRYRRFVGVQMLPVATCACFVVLLVILPLRFIGLEGRSEREAGLLMLALSAPMLVVPMAAAALARRVPPGLLSGLGLLAAASGLVWLGFTEIGNRAVLAPMLLIGLGSGLPWGLMDGLSVAVVPRARAGMAAGIFGTVRVAGEGVALALVSATLAGLAAVALRRAPGRPTAPCWPRPASAWPWGPGRRPALLPGLDGAALIQAYQAAFATLSWTLAAVTVVCAVAVFGLLAERTDNVADAGVGL
ncbi:MFS transporter [Methylobacterium sp. WL1]|uniref:MFS transporter n=1 Tax=Methylobacterium sp. WL1 TaxID=2603276 RepID=UPI0011C1DD94|nr:MFS transporter [Methylobacterium sp. WL1]QEE39291.1 MFS transporter [Methylobacterium sp. WL1]